ncbi:Diacylglycerol kinase eta [Dirofilaria immitis]
MDRKQYSANKDDLSQSSQVVCAIDAFTASDYLVGNSMDNIEGVLRLLMNNPHNLRISKHHPNDNIERTQIVKSITPIAEKFQRTAASITRGFSAESMIGTNREFVQSSMQRLKSSGNIEPQISSSSTSAPYVFIFGPVRVQTIQKIDGRSMDKLFIDEILELYGSGVKYPNKELISINPKILESPTITKNTPITVQSVRVGCNYVRIDRKIELERSKIESPQVAMNTKEVTKFDSDGLIQEKQETKPGHRKSKSEAILLKTPVFNLIGPLIITAFQNTVHDTKGNYKIYEEIELRADGSTAKPEITVIPFLRKESILPKNEKQKIPINYQEDILVGYNVMLIKRLIEIKPFFQKQMHDFTLSEERNYVTDKSIHTASTESTSNIGERRKMLVLQEPSVKTDLTALSSSSAEPAESIHKNGKIEEILRTAKSSSEISNEDRRIIKKFDKFQIIRHAAPINRTKIRTISKRKHHKSKVSETPTETFLNAELSTARSLHNVSKMKDSKNDDYALQAHSDSVHTGISFSSAQVKLQEGASKSPVEAELLTARSIVTAKKPNFIEDERKRSDEFFFFPTKKPVLSETIDSSSKIQRIYRYTSSPMMKKNIRSSTRFQPIFYSPISYPPTPPRSPRRKRKHKLFLDSPQEDQIITAVPPEGFSSSDSTYESDSSMDEDKNVSRSTEEAPSTGFISRDQTFKSNESSQLFEPKKKKFYTVSEKDRLLSQKRRFGLLPPTPSIISNQPRSTNGNDENIVSQSPRSKEALLETNKKMYATSKITSKAIRSRFERFPMQTRPGHEKSLSSIKRSQIKRRPSLVTSTQESDDTRSSNEREPSKWFETNLFMDQSELGSRIQKTSKSFDSNVPIMRQTATLKPSVTKSALSTIPDTSAKKKSEANLTKGTSLMIQSKDEGNLTANSAEYKFSNKR